MGVHRGELQEGVGLTPGESRLETLVRQRIVYGRSQRPLVEVRVLGTWCRGRLCFQVEDLAGVWWSRVTYLDPERRISVLGRFRTDDVRRVSSGSPTS